MSLLYQFRFLSYIKYIHILQYIILGARIWLRLTFLFEAYFTVMSYSMLLPINNNRQNERGLSLDKKNIFFSLLRSYTHTHIPIHIFNPLNSIGKSNYKINKYDTWREPHMFTHCQMYNKQTEKKCYFYAIGTLFPYYIYDETVSYLVHQNTSRITSCLFGKYENVAVQYVRRAEKVWHGCYFFFLV